MKKLILSLVALFVATMSFAQSELIATLTHEGKTKIFKNNTALQEALKVAQDGDIITLSEGQFFAGEITKNVTLRGMGMSVNKSEDNGHGSTVVTQTVKINIPADAKGKLRIDGVYFRDSLQYYSDIKNAMFEKCRFNTIRYVSTSDTQFGKLSDCTFLHCRVANSMNISQDSHVSFHNSVVRNPQNAEKLNSNFEFLNCVVLLTTYWTLDNGNKYYYGQAVKNSVYRNCIIKAGLIGTATSEQINSALSSTCTVTYCYGNMSNSSWDRNVFQNLDAIANTTNKVVNWNSSWIDYSDTSQYIISDEIKAKYLGSDGTVAGIHGGSMPYTEDPVRPRLLKVQTSTRTTSKGILPVRIDAKDSYGN